MAFATSPSAFGIKPATTGSAFGAQSQPSGSNTNPSPFGAFSASSSQQPVQQQPSLFGGSTGQNQSQPQGQNQQGIFGQQQPQQGIFGQQQPQQGISGQQQPQQSIFGQQQPQQGISGQQQPQQGIFGQQQHQQGISGQQQPQQGIFGQQQPQQGIFGQQQPQQPSVGGVLGASQQQAPPVFTRTTRFNDLPEQIQKTLDSIDTHIQGRIQISNDLKARSLDEAPTKGAELIRKVHNDLVNTMSTLQADKSIAEELRSKVDESVQDTIITTRIMDGFRNPQQNGAYLKNHANFPLEFFTRAADEIRQKLQWYKTTIEQIERRLASAQNAVQYNPQAITATLQAQNSTFIALAGKTAELDADLQKIKSIYRELWRAHTGSARDPFNEVDRRPGDGGGMLNGIGSLNLSR